VSIFFVNEKMSSTPTMISKGYQALETQKKELAQKGNYQQRAQAYIKANAGERVVEYRVVVEPWRETRRHTVVDVGVRIVAWAINAQSDQLNFNYSIFRVGKKDFVNIKWAKGEAMEHALEKLFKEPIALRFENPDVAKAVQANLGRPVSSFGLSELKTFMRVDKTHLHRILRDISRLGRKNLTSATITLGAEISQEPIWDRSAVTKAVKKMYQRPASQRKRALSMIK